MSRPATNADSNDGFTLLEVVLAAVILATAVAAILAVFVRSTNAASSACDITIATSVARNALEEALAQIPEQPAEGKIPERPSLRLTYSQPPADKEKDLPSTDTFVVGISRDGKPLVSFTAERALYIEKPEENGGAAEGKNE